MQKTERKRKNMKERRKKRRTKDREKREKRGKERIAIARLGHANLPAPSTHTWWKRVWLTLSLAFMSAPACCRHCTTAKWPQRAAHISAVQPSCAPESGHGTFHWRAGGGWIFVNKGLFAPCKKMLKNHFLTFWPLPLCVFFFAYSCCFDPYLAYFLLSPADCFCFRPEM